MVGETVYIRERKGRADVKLKITPVISGTALDLVLYSTGDLDFTPSGTADHTVTLTFDAAGNATHTFTTHAKKTSHMLDYDEYKINWQGDANTEVRQHIYTLYGAPVDNGPGTVAAVCPRHIHLKYLLGPEMGDEGDWCWLLFFEPTLKEKYTDSVVYAVYQGIIDDGTLNLTGDALPDVWQVVSGSGGRCLEFAELMKAALLVAGVPDQPNESTLKVRNVVSKIVRTSWLGGAGKTVLQSFYEVDNPGQSTWKWLNQGCRHAG